MTKNILIISILLFILSSILFGRVPIDENKIRITSTFGEFRTDHFHNGVDFGGSKMEIYPMADGEIVHYFDIAEDPTRQLYGVGNTIILEHPNGIRSYYYHIEDGTIEKSFAKVTERDIIAFATKSLSSSSTRLSVARVSPAAPIFSSP